MEDEKKYVYVKPKNKITPFAVFNTISYDFDIRSALELSRR